MSLEHLPNFPTQPDAQKLEWPIFFESLKTSLQAANPPNPLGFMGACYTPAEWLILHPHQVYEAPADPGDPPVLAAGQVPWKFLYDRYSNFVSREQDAKTQLLSKLDPTSTAVVREADGTLSGTRLATIILRLRTAYGVATPLELTANANALARPYQPPSLLSDHLLKHRSAHAYAAAHGAPYAEPQKVDLLIKSMLPCNLFQQPLDLYPMLYRTVLAQTFELLAGMLTECAARSASQTTVVAAGYVNAVTAPQLASLEELLRSMQADFRAASATKNAAGGTAPRASPAAFAPGNVHYCWTHGAKSAHPSFACMKPAQGHQSKATAKATLGGKA